MGLRYRVKPPSQAPSVTAVQDAQPLPLAQRRARAAQRAWALMPTSIPTRDILSSYLDDILSSP
jgi:hypothetical protein